MFAASDMDFDAIKTLPRKEAFKALEGCIAKTKRKTGTKSTLQILETLPGEIKKLYLSLAEKYKEWKEPSPTDARIDVGRLLEEMSCMITGVRPGEIVKGTSTQAKGALLRLDGEVVPPSSEYLDAIRNDDSGIKYAGTPAAFVKFLRRLEIIPFFGNLSLVERRLWIEDHESDADVYFEDVDGVTISVLAVGDSDFHLLGEEVITDLLSAGSLPALGVARMFPFKPGSKGLSGKSTLIFRRGIWKVENILKEVSTPPEDAVVFTTIPFDMRENFEDAEGEVAYLQFDGLPKEYSYRGETTQTQSIYIGIPKGAKSLPPKKMWERMLKSCAEPQPHYNRDRASEGTSKDHPLNRRDYTLDDVSLTLTILQRSLRPRPTSLFFKRSLDSGL